MALGTPLGSNYQSSSTGKKPKKPPQTIPQFGSLNTTFADPLYGTPQVKAPRPTTPYGTNTPLVSPYREDNPSFMGPLPSSSTQAANQLNQGYQSALDFYITATGAERAFGDFSRSQLLQQLGLVQANQGLQSRFSQEGYSTDLARLNLQQQELGIDKAANQRALSMYDELLGLSSEDFNRTMATLDLFDGTDSTKPDRVVNNKIPRGQLVSLGAITELGMVANAQTGGLIQEQLALQLQALGIDEQQASLSADIAARSLLSDATARGAVLAPGTTQGQKDIKDQLALQLQSIGISKKEAERVSREALVNLRERKGQLRTDYRRDTIGLQEQKSKVRDAEKQLELRGKDLGLRKDQLRTTLEQGLAKLNLDTVISVNDLMTAIVSGDFKQQQLANDIISQATNAAGYFASLPGGVQKLGANGRLDKNQLTPIGSGHYMHPVAATAWQRLVADAAAQGVNITITDSYRDYATQERLVKEKGLYSQGGLAAKPGHSKHGDALAVDVDQGRDWLAKNAAKYGFLTIPDEPWHWEYAGGTGGSHAGHSHNTSSTASKPTVVSKPTLPQRM